MVDPYKTDMAAKVRFVAKRVVRATFVVVLKGTIKNRGLELIAPGSRCVRKGEVFELIATAEETARPGGRVDQAAYLGFCEVQTGGVVRVGDRVEIAGQLLGSVAGFDETHAPNHENVVVRVPPDEIPPAIEYGLADEITFTLAAS